MTLRHRITASLSLLLLLVTLAALVSAWAASRTDAGVEALRQAAERRTRIAAVQHAVLDRAREVAILTELSLTPSQEQALRARLDTLTHAVAGLDTAAGEPAARRSLSTGVEAFTRHARRAFAHLVAGRRAQAGDEAAKASAEAEVLLTIASVRMAEEDAHVAAATRDLVATARTANRATLGMLLLSLVGTLALATAASLHVTRGVAALRRGTEALSDGLTGARVAEAGDEEFRELARAFNVMASRLEAALAEAREARARAEQASAAKGALLCNMSHELRTPLTALLGYADLVHAAALARDDRTGAEDAEQIRTAARLLLSLVNQIVDLAKIERGRMRVDCLEVAVGEIAGNVVSLLRPLAEANGTALSLVVGRDPGTVVTDGGKVRQILVNLVGNACKFTRGGRIEVTLDRAVVDGEERVVLVVADTGIGMTAEQAARIFDEFEQAEPSTERAYGGSGLGLAITRRLCELLGGSITVTSQPGGGTTFTVRLPRHPPVGAHDATAADPQLASVA